MRWPASRAIRQEAAARAVTSRRQGAAPPRSAGAADPGLVPDRAVGLVDVAVGAVDQVAVEAAGEPAVVGDGDDGALEGFETGLERLGGLDVEVVGAVVAGQRPPVLRCASDASWVGLGALSGRWAWA